MRKLPTAPPENDDGNRQVRTSSVRRYLLHICFSLCLPLFILAQRPADQKTIPPAPVQPKNTDDRLKSVFEAKVKAEWDALKNKDKRAYGDLLADDYQGVEIDGQGERNKTQAITELAASNVFDYTLWGLKVIPLGSDAALVIYESTMLFPPKSVLRYSRVYIAEIWVKRDGEWKELHYQETHVK